jgi:hypothetical protein
VARPGRQVQRFPIQEEIFVIYKFREGSRFPVKPQPAGEELSRIADLNGGNLIPGAVRDESRSDDAYLHECFDWNDWTAAEAHREEQARRLIRSIVSVERVPGEAEPRQVIAYVHVRTAEGEPCYMTTARVMSDAELRSQAIADVLSLLNGVRRRYEHLDELRGIFEEVDRAAQQEAERQEAARRAPAKKKRARAAQPRA